MAAVFPVPPIPQNATVYLAGVAEPFHVSAEEGERVEAVLTSPPSLSRSPRLTAGV